MLRLHPISPLFPYTTLFRSLQQWLEEGLGLVRRSTDGLRQLLGGSREISFIRIDTRSEEHTSELQSLRHLVCRLLLEKKKQIIYLLQHMLDETQRFAIETQS